MFRMTSNILRNLFARKATRRYPAVKRAPFANGRGELFIDVQTCTFCSVCAVKCPSRCLRVDKKNAGWSCDPFACVYCGICVEVCPTHCLSLLPMYRAASCHRESVSLHGEPKQKDSAP